MKILLGILVIAMFMISFTACNAPVGEASKALSKDSTKIKNNPKFTKPAVVTAPPTTLSEEVLIGEAISKKLGTKITVADFGGMKKQTYVQNGVTKRAYEYLEFRPNTPSVETGLTFSQNIGEKWGDKVFVPALANSMKYTYEFVDVPDYSAITIENPITLKLLGNDVVIDNMDSTSNSLSVMFGQKFDLTAGDTVVVDGREITFVSATGGETTTYVNETAELLVMINGTNETGLILKRQSGVINGLPITVTAAFYDENIMYGSAILNVQVNNTNTTLQTNYGIPYTVGPYTIILLSVQGTAVVNFLEDKALFTSSGLSNAATEGETVVIGTLKVMPLIITNFEGVENDKVTAIIGSETVKTYRNGDEYIGEPSNYFMWEWNINLNNNPPTLGVVQAEDANIDNPNDADVLAYQHPLYLGESYYFPNNYVEVKFDDTIPANETGEEQTVVYILEPTTKSLYPNNNSPANYTNAKVLRNTAFASPDHGFLAGTTTMRVYLRSVNSDPDCVEIYRKDSRSTKAIYFKTACTNGDQLMYQLVAGEAIIDVTYENFNGTNNTLERRIVYNFLQDDMLAVHVEPSAPGEFTYLGDGDSVVNQVNDLLHLGESITITDISAWEQKTRTKYGVVIRDPDYFATLDKLFFSVPTERIKVRINLIGVDNTVPPPRDDPVLREAIIG